MTRRGRLSVEDYAAGVLANDVSVLSRAITLVESTQIEDRGLAATLVDTLLPKSGGSHRVGITGVPGVGKSTFIEALGCQLLAKGHRVAVLAVDPSSPRTGGSILGDKTRMERLAVDPRAYIRPSPSGGTLGGVARATRAAIVLLEAAGFDVVLVETVGVGQSEVAVAGMVDTFLALMLPGAGDALQGIKKGLLELVDVLCVHKADGDLRTSALNAARTYEAALHIVAGPGDGWTPVVTTASSVTGDGLTDVWSAVERHQSHVVAQGTLGERRAAQQVRWLWEILETQLVDDFRAHTALTSRLPAEEAAVRAGETAPPAAALRLRAIARQNALS